MPLRVERVCYQDGAVVDLANLPGNAHIGEIDKRAISMCRPWRGSIPTFVRVYDPAKGNHAHLTWAQVHEIRRLRILGASAPILALEFEVETQVIHDVLGRRTWPVIEYHAESGTIHRG